mmetsp:Transcript_41132/g.130274  ORF Transcript_41132/g.130274 Transcript_41132/m.130274 type:complete len:281 (-) Transcript_41132:574-1416(-)
MLHTLLRRTLGIHVRPEHGGARAGHHPEAQPPEDRLAAASLGERVQIDQGSGRPLAAEPKTRVPGAPPIHVWTILLSFVVSHQLQSLNISFWNFENRRHLRPHRLDNWICAAFRRTQDRRIRCPLRVVALGVPRAAAAGRAPERGGVGQADELGGLGLGDDVENGDHRQGLRGERLHTCPTGRELPEGPQDAPRGRGVRVRGRLAELLGGLPHLRASPGEDATPVFRQAAAGDLRQGTPQRIEEPGPPLARAREGPSELRQLLRGGRRGGAQPHRRIARR